MHEHNDQPEHIAGEVDAVKNQGEPVQVWLIVKCSVDGKDTGRIPKRYVMI